MSLWNGVIFIISGEARQNNIFFFTLHKWQEHYSWKSSCMWDLDCQNSKKKYGDCPYVLLSSWCLWVDGRNCHLSFFSCLWSARNCGFQCALSHKGSLFMNSIFLNTLEFVFCTVHLRLKNFKKCKPTHFWVNVPSIHLKRKETSFLLCVNFTFYCC